MPDPSPSALEKAARAIERQIEEAKSFTEQSPETMAFVTIVPEHAARAAILAFLGDEAVKRVAAELAGLEYDQLRDEGIYPKCTRENFVANEWHRHETVARFALTALKTMAAATAARGDDGGAG